MKSKIPFIKPSFPSAKDVAEDYSQIVDSNWFTNFGPYEKKFTQQATEYIGGGVKGTTVANATLGLFVAIKIFFKNEKTKVIVPSFTFAAGPEMLILTGFKPVFIDITEESWQPNYNQAYKYIKENINDVAGILLCNTFGVGNGSIELWEKMAKEFDLPMIIDSAAGFGSQYVDGSKVGTRGDCEIFSLHATKPFAVGEGGLIFSKHARMIEDIKSFENFGFNDQKTIGSIGINAKLQEINAAIGIRQLQSFDVRLQDRRASLEKIKQELLPLGFLFQHNDEKSTIPFVSVVVQTETLANTILQELIKSGVEARKYYAPLHTQTLILEQSEVAYTLENTENIYSRIISLPLHDSMSNENIEHITTVIKQTYEKNT